MLSEPSFAEAYRRDGVAVLRCAVPADTVLRITEELEGVIAHPSIMARTYGDAAAPFLVDTMMHRRSPALRALIFSSLLVGHAKSLIGDDSVHFFYDQLFYKGPGSDEPTQWHQDLPFWPLRGEDIPSFWISLTAVDQSSSGVCYVRGSHRESPLYEAVDPAEGGERQRCPNFNEELPSPDGRLLSFALKPGDVVVHHPRIIHGAGPNPSDSPRIAVSIRYFGGETLWAPRARTMFFPGLTGILPDGTAVKHCTSAFPHVMK